MTPSRRAIGMMAASLTLAALPAAAIAVPTTQVGARNAMLVPGDARAAGLPASLGETFTPEFNEKIWLCDAKGTSAVTATASSVTYVANTEQSTKGLQTEVSQDISVFRSAADASAAFATVVSKARSCKGSVASTEDGPLKQKTIRRSNGTAPFAFGGQQAVWTSQLTPGPGGLKKLNEDIVVPRGRWVDLMKFAARLQKKYGFPLACFGHAGDGNIHVNIMVENPDDLAVQARSQAALDALFTQVLAWQGAITGEHGIGLAKKPWWHQALSEENRALHQTLKNALDPAGLLNPGKFL